MPFVVKHTLLGYLVAPATRDEERVLADDNDVYGGERKQAKRFKTREQAEEAVGPLAELCEIVRVQK